MALFRVVIDHPLEGGEGGERLLQLQESAQTAAEYALTFRTMAASSGLNEPALRILFRRRLCKQLQTELACRNDSHSLDALTAMTIHLDNLLCERGDPHCLSPSSFGRPETEPEPMEVGSTNLPAAELGHCPYCGQ